MTVPDTGTKSDPQAGSDIARDPSFASSATKSVTRRRLILTRHAKSAWDNPLLEDHDRPLNRRGLRAALELGEWLGSRGYLPEEVLCSSAVRTRETWAVIERAPLEVLPVIKVEGELYNASCDSILARIKRCTADTVMVLGHNPGIGELAARLAAQPPASAEFRKYPSAATLVLDFQLKDWDEISFGSGAVLDFFLPADKS